MIGTQKNKRARSMRFALALALATVLGSPGLMLAAAGDTPSNPLTLAIDGASRTVTLSPARPEVWLLASGSPRGISQLDIQTTGDHDTELFIYQDAAAAANDDPLAYDDDSGTGLNARVEQFLGFSLPWLVRVRMYDPGDAGNVGVGSSASFAAPGHCSGSGPCPFSIAAAGRTDGRRLLETMRGIRSLVLHRTPRGRQLIDLYYDMSRELVYEAVVDSTFRDHLFQLGSSLDSVLTEALAVGIGDRSSAVVGETALSTARGLHALVESRVRPETAARLSVWMSELEGQAGATFEQAMASLGLLPAERGEFALAAASGRPVKAGTLVVKTRRAMGHEPYVQTGRAFTGLESLDGILEGFSVESAGLLFGPGAETVSEGLDRVMAVRVESSRREELAARLAASSEIEYVESVAVAFLSSDDLYSEYQYGPEAIGASVAGPTTAATRPLVAIIDTGIDPRQADVAGSTRVDLGWNFVDDNADTMDDHGHGTHVGGTVASRINNIYSVAGVAPESQLIPYKVCDSSGSCTFDAVAAAIVRAADAGARVINLSLGGSSTSQAVEDAMAYAAARGVIIVAAAGNDGQDGSSFPASSAWALSIGATDADNALAGFSNYGDIDLAAPGVDIVNLWLGGESCYNSGTSMAAPHAVGAAALVASRLPGLSREQIVGRLLGGADDLGDPGYDATFGNGLVNTLNALFAGCMFAPTLELSGVVVGSTDSYVACARIRAGSGFTVAAGGILELRSGLQVELGNGFTVENGAALEIALDPALGIPQ